MTTTTYRLRWRLTSSTDGRMMRDAELRRMTSGEPVLVLNEPIQSCPVGKRRH